MSEGELDENIWGPAPSPEDIPPEPVWDEILVHEVQPGDYIKILEYEDASTHIPLGAVRVGEETAHGHDGDIFLHISKSINIDARHVVLRARWPNGERWPSGNWKKAVRA